MLCYLEKRMKARRSLKLIDSSPFDVSEKEAIVGIYSSFSPSPPSHSSPRAPLLELVACSILPQEQYQHLEMTHSPSPNQRENILFRYNPKHKMETRCELKAIVNHAMLNKT